MPILENAGLTGTQCGSVRSLYGHRYRCEFNYGHRGEHQVTPGGQPKPIRIAWTATRRPPVAPQRP